MRKHDILRNSNILAITDDFWDCHKSVRHRIPLKWSEMGNKVVWVEQTPFINQFKRGDTTLSNSLRPVVRKISDTFTVVSMLPAFPRMLKGGVLSNALLSVHGIFDKLRLGIYLKHLKFVPDVIVLFQQPMRRDLLTINPEALTVYYCSDLYGFGNATRNEVKGEAECCKIVDAVFTTSEKLRERLLPFNDQTWHIPHAVDLQWWDKHKNQMPKDIQNIEGPILLFVGHIFERLDFDVIFSIAKNCKNWNLVFVGPVKCESIPIDKLRSFNNIHLLGSKDWTEIPGYINHSDVLSFLYAKKIVAANSGLPFKFYEYAISGKPIVSTDYGEIEVPDEDFVTVCKTTEEWVEVLQKFENCEVKNNPSAAKRIGISYQNSYETRFDFQKKVLDRIALEKYS